jgi:S-formylglutathione hydrolase FrmB
MTSAQAAALQVSVTPASSLAPIAVVTVDGGGGYWNWHPGDDPTSMVVDELIPMCQARGLGRSAHGVGLMGISMGGYGTLAIAERYPDLIRAVAAISPAVWTSYDQARGANAGAFTSAAAFAANDVITHASALSKTAVRVTSGADDPFHPGVVQLIKALPTGNMSVVIDPGCHTDPFFVSQEPASLAFLATNLS